MRSFKVNAAYTKTYKFFSAAFLCALLCFGVVMLAEQFGLRWAAFAGIIVGGIAILVGVAAVIAMLARNFRRRE